MLFVYLYRFDFVVSMVSYYKVGYWVLGWLVRCLCFFVCFVSFHLMMGCCFVVVVIVLG